MYHNIFLSETLTFNFSINRLNPYKMLKGIFMSYYKLKNSFRFCFDSNELNVFHYSKSLGYNHEDNESHCEEHKRWIVLYKTMKHRHSLD
jgi:hypothetical protein